MTSEQTLKELGELIEIMAILRSPEGCPWDCQQTPESLKPYLLEETYELLEAIDSCNPTDIRDELGDLLLQIVFLARIFNERKVFDLADVARSINSKMIRRHPHVFGDADHADHARRWEEIKRQERAERGGRGTIEEQIPKELPALKKATKLGKKIEQVPVAEQIASIRKSYDSLAECVTEPDNSEKLRTLLGEILFSTARLSATLQVDAEDLLRSKTAHLIREIDTAIDASSGHNLKVREK